MGKDDRKMVAKSAGKRSFKGLVSRKKGIFKDFLSSLWGRK